MSWLFSQVLVEEYLAANSLDGEPFVQLSGKPTQQAYCAPDKMTDFSRLSRFGMTYKPLTDISGEELSMSSVVAFHVRTLVQQEKAQELMENDQECGEKWLASFVKYDPDTSLWRTHQCSLLGDLDEFLETWPQWGLMRDGECWEQRTLERLTRGTESGLSPNGVDSFHTPNTTGLDGGSNSRRALKNRQETWTTPTSRDWKGTTISKNHPNGFNQNLANDVMKWPTPTASQARSEGMILQMRKMVESGTTTLEEAEAMIGGSLTPKRMEKWPTPVHSEARQGLQIRRNGKKGSQQSLSTAVMTWPTPRTKGMCGGSGSWDLLNKNTTLEEARQMGAGNGGQLNPTWVEWLMGWPQEWTDLKPLATDKSHCAPQQHGES